MFAMREKLLLLLDRVLPEITGARRDEIADEILKIFRKRGRR
jgi:hypothetical protein